MSASASSSRLPTGSRRRTSIEVLEISSGESSDSTASESGVVPLSNRSKLMLPTMAGKRGRGASSGASTSGNGNGKGKGKGKEEAPKKRMRLSPSVDPIDLTAESDSPSPSPSLSPTVASSTHSRSPTPTSLTSTPLPPPLSHLTCPICLGPPTPIAITKCGHVYCAPCLHAALVAGHLDESATNAGLGPAAVALAAANADPLDGHCPICRIVLRGGWGRDIRGVLIRNEKEGAEMIKERKRKEKKKAERLANGNGKSKAIEIEDVERDE